MFQYETPCILTIGLTKHKQIGVGKITIFFAYHNPVLEILMQVLNAMQLSATQCLWSQLLLLLLCSAPHVICRKLCQEQEEFQPCLQNHTRTVSMPYLSDKDTLWNKIEIFIYLVKAKNPVYFRSSLLNINP